MRKSLVLTTLCAVTLTGALSGCVSGCVPGSQAGGAAEEAPAITFYSQAPINEGKGVIVTAENSTDTNPTVSKGILNVADGEGIVVTPALEQGSIHVTITLTDSEDTVYDGDVEGSEPILIEADTGTYDVATTPTDATGEVNITAE